MELGKRKYSRCDFSQIIKYSICPYIEDNVLTGLLQDFSSTGLCIITKHPLKEGQEIFLKSSLMNNSINAVVRWCTDTGNSTYKAGLEFKK
jgi:hypothetical protein